MKSFSAASSCSDRASSRRAEHDLPWVETLKSRAQPAENVRFAEGAKTA